MAEIDIPIAKLKFDESSKQFTANLTELYDMPIPMRHYPLSLCITRTDIVAPILMTVHKQKRKDGELLWTDYHERYGEHTLRIFHDAEFEDLANSQ